ncbi:hypothetical protein CWM52_05240 [Raoultella sp. T31]|nr:hypothetical protein CWM52_05240 [Raoultella sp. T31]
MRFAPCMRKRDRTLAPAWRPNGGLRKVKTGIKIFISFFHYMKLNFYLCEKDRKIIKIIPPSAGHLMNGRLVKNV